VKSWDNDTSAVYPRLCQWSAVIGGLDFSRSLFLVYFLSLGFSGAETGVLQAILFWSSFALELPTGIFADRFGRKKSVMVGLSGMAVTFALLATSRSFWPAAAAFFLWGTSFTFISGAGSALLYDGLKEGGRLGSHLQWLGRTRSLSTLGMALAIFAGGWLYDWSAVSIFWVSAICALAGAVLLWPVPEPKIHVEANQPAVGLRQFFSSRRGRDLLIFLTGMALIEMAHTPFFIFSQTMFHQLGLSDKAVSFVLGGGFVLSALAQRWAPRWQGTSPLTLVLAVSVILSGALAALWLPLPLAAYLGLFAVINTLPQFLFVHTDQYVQDHCDSRIRASLLSVQSFVNALFIGAAYIGVGAVSDRLGMAGSLAGLAVPTLVGAALVAWHFARTRKLT
jgi:MFS family permease